MDYFILIKDYIFLILLISSLLYLPTLYKIRTTNDKLISVRSTAIYVFIVYMVIITILVILPLKTTDALIVQDNYMQLIPFQAFFDIIRYAPFELNNIESYWQTLNYPLFYTCLLNILMLIPFGMFMKYYFKLNCKQIVIISFLLSLTFECIQLSGFFGAFPMGYRLFDVDDLICNTLGGFLGYYMALPCMTFYQQSKLYVRLKA